MTGRRALLAASLGAASFLAVASPARAQSAPPPTVLTTIDSVERSEGYFAVVATVRGEATPRSLEIWTNVNSNGTSASGDACERAFLLMMNRPGRFTLELRQPSGDYYSLCKLVRQ